MWRVCLSHLEDDFGFTTEVAALKSQRSLGRMERKELSYECCIRELKKRRVYFFLTSVKESPIKIRPVFYKGEVGQGAKIPTT